MTTQAEALPGRWNDPLTEKRLKPILWVLLAIALLALCGAVLIPRFGTWFQLGEVRLTDACNGGGCDLDVALDRRFGYFSLSTDASRSLPLTGSLQVFCTDGQQFTNLLISPNGPGVFQGMGNPCTNLDATRVVVHVETVQVPQVDLRVGVHLTLYTRRL